MTRRPDEQRTQKLAALTGITLAAGCLVGGYYYWRTQNPDASYSAAGFDVNRVEAQQAQGVSYTAPAKAAPTSSPAPLVGGVNVSFDGRQAQQPVAKFVKDPATAEELKREQEWLQRNGAVLRAYMPRLARITRRYYQSSPVVREVDKAFGAMPRYMAVRAKYMKEGNPFAFAREAMALPEVRQEITKRMADPRVWRDSVLMILDALKDPPPASIYKEAQRFVTKDPTMVDYLPEFTGQVTGNIGTAMRGIPKDTDLTPLQRVMHDVAPNAASGALQAGNPPEARRQ